MAVPHIRARLHFTLPAVLFYCLLVALWVAGGSARADASGQIVVRAVAAGVLILALLLGPRPAFADTRPVMLLFGAALLLVLAQLVPLPPFLWQALPGREILAEAALGGPQPWRPLAIVPGAAMNAAESLLVPLAMLVLLTMSAERERALLPAALFVAVFAAGLLALLQFCGVRFDNPFINESALQVSGIFANRNHLALFLAFGCLLAPVWALRRSASAWRVGAVLALWLFFTLLILATGSRAGVLVNLIALCAGLAIAWPGLLRVRRRFTHWARPAGLIAVACLIVGFLFASMASNRAVGIVRLFSGDIGEDMRARSLPTVLEMIRTYFPFGSGQGSFDPVFRIHEPLALLKLTYFNHAHDDFLETALTAGLPGLLLLAAAIGWWGLASLRVWRAPTSGVVTNGRLGSAMLLVILVASLFDYPVRTPMMMAVTMLAAMWLSWGVGAIQGATLPASAQHL